MRWRRGSQGAADGTGDDRGSGGAGLPVRRDRAESRSLRDGFGNSVFGGPTTCALWRSAVTHDVPVRYLWDEGLVQYGYGRRSTRGASTTFDRDSQLGSDFTTRKDDRKAFLDSFGFPIPSSVVVTSPEEALEAAGALRWPVVIKPLSGHQGLGATADDISRSWREGGFGTIEINAAPGITMHLRPDSERPVDAPSRIIETFYREGVDSRVPIVAFNRLSAVELRRHLDAPLDADLRVNPGGRLPIAEVAVETFLAEG